MGNRFRQAVQRFLFCMDLYHQECIMVLRGNRLLCIIIAAMAIFMIQSQEQILWKIAYLVLLYLFLMLSIIDRRHYIIPDVVLQCGILVCVIADILRLWMQPTVLITSLFMRSIHGLAIFVPLLLFILLMDWLLQKETMGGGDLKLFFVVGFIFGTMQALLVLFLACMIGILWQIGLYLRRQDKLLPFGPSIALASWVVVLYGEQLIEKFFCIL